ncbi:(R)-mandelonitrile lyase-like [Sesamum alatum]|uniref:(R)-mandelonitrile lyase-like n=1 Tax=Sesamum alatum TaxID=300844 RepID=A0AAE1XYB6_9LAMI|nr:(R)-mandelonitrile lyase-like [Sesamum alatum]
MTYCRRWPSQGQSTINVGFYSRADHEFYQKFGVNWDLRVVNKDGLLEAGVDPYNGFSLVGTKIGGSTFDGSGRRHSAADLLNYENPVNIKVAVYASVERILLSSSSPYSGSKQSAMKQLPMSYLLPPLLALFSFGT